MEGLLPVNCSSAGPSSSLSLLDAPYCPLSLSLPAVTMKASRCLRLVASCTGADFLEKRREVEGRGAGGGGEGLKKGMRQGVAVWGTKLGRRRSIVQDSTAKHSKAQRIQPHAAEAPRTTQYLIVDWLGMLSTMQLSAAQHSL